MSTPPSPSPASKWIKAVPWAIFFAALLIRIIGIGWGLPTKDRHWSYHPDEPVNLFYAKQISVGKFDFEPGGFYNYGTLYLTMLSVASDMADAYSPPKENDPDALYVQWGKAHLAGRWLSAIAGAVTALLAFLMARRFLSVLSAVFCGLAIAFAPGHVVHSQFATVDVVATCFIVASAACALRLLSESGEAAMASRERWKWTLLSGMFAGLSMGTKYNGILVLVVLAATIPWKPDAMAIKSRLAALGLALLTFVITTPGVLTNTAQFIEDFQYEVRHASTGHGLVFEGLPSGFLVQMGNLSVGLGPILCLAGVAGLIWGLVRKDRAMIAIGAFGLLYFALIGSAEVLFMRYTFPLYLGLALGLGYAIDRLQAAPKAKHVANVAGILLVMGLPFPGGLLMSGKFSSWMAGTDVRDHAAGILRSMAKDKPDFTVGYVSDPWFYSPPLFPEATAPRFVPLQVRLESMMTASSPRAIQYLPPNPEERSDWDVRLITELKPDAIVYSSFESDDLVRLSTRQGLRPEVQQQVDRFKAFVEELKESYELKVGIAGSVPVHDMQYIHPDVAIWVRKPTP